MRFRRKHGSSTSLSSSDEKQKLKFRRNIFLAAGIISGLFLAFSIYTWNLARSALNSCAYPPCIQSPVVTALTSTFLFAAFIMDVSTGLTIIVLGIALRFHLQARRSF